MLIKALGLTAAAATNTTTNCDISLVILSYILSLTSETTNDSGVVPPMARLHMMERNPIVGLLLTVAV